MPVRAIVIDDHIMFREGLISILASRGAGIEVVGHCSTGEEAFALLRERSPDVVITQIDVDLHTAKEDTRGFPRLQDRSSHHLRQPPLRTGSLQARHRRLHPQDFLHT
jgi:DNA-binding NarL/FixJ family response regulator